MSWVDFVTLVSSAVGGFYLIRCMLQELERRSHVVRQRSAAQNRVLVQRLRRAPQFEHQQGAVTMVRRLSSWCALVSRKDTRLQCAISYHLRFSLVSVRIPGKIAGGRRLRTEDDIETTPSGREASWYTCESPDRV